MPIALTISDEVLRSAMVIPSNDPTQPPMMQVSLDQVDPTGQVIRNVVDSNPVPTELIPLFEQFAGAWIAQHKARMGI